jgi:hypothetical protein
MATTKGFICPGCGRDHEGLPTDQGFKLPDDVWAIPEPEREKRTKYDSDRCKFGDRYFMRCILYVPFDWDDNAFGWGVWVEVSRATFDRYLEIYNEDGSAEPPATATLANALGAYPDAPNEKVLVRFGDSTSRPTLEVLAESRSSLAVEQRNGINQERYHAILHEIGAL